MTRAGSDFEKALRVKRVEMVTLKSIACSLALAALLSACSPFRNDHVEGLRMLEAGRLSEAWRAFERGYEKDPDSAYSLNNMGYVLEMRDGKIFKAARFYRRAIEACEAYRDADPGLARLEKMARENLTRVLWKIGRSRMLQVNARDPSIRCRTS